MARDTVAARWVTLIDMLRGRGLEHPDRVCATFLGDGEHEKESWTYQALDDAAMRIAGVLQTRGLAGTRVVVMGPTCADYVAAFFGCVYAGAIAVPWRPGVSTRDVKALGAIVEDCRSAAVLVCGPNASSAEARHRGAVPAGMAWLPVEEWANTGDRWKPPALTGESVAYLQYTSGSTSEPKGAVILHRNVLANEAMITDTFAQDERSVVVGWLPLYHDMGLVGTVLQPFYAGGRTVLFPPAAFLQQPVRWLRAITRYRATTSGAPDFAFELCSRKISDAEKSTLDLRCWSVAFNGSEPVRAQTMERFVTTFAPAGFSQTAFVPCYGLAEATLLVSAARHEARTSISDTPAGGAGATAVVSCGKPAGRGQVVVVDPKDGRVLPDGSVGEIHVFGPHVCAGYWNRPELTAATPEDDARDGARLRTGDLGFLKDGRLYVTGRLKDLIIVRGANHYPQDIEYTSAKSHADAVPGGAAAFTVAEAERERVVIVQEIGRHASANADTICAAIRQAVWAEHELALDEIILVKAGTIPKTSSGKVRRAACRQACVERSLETVARERLRPPARDEEWIAWPEVAAGAPDERAAALSRYVRQRVAAVLGTAIDRTADQRRLGELGLDSMRALELAALVENETGRPALSMEWLGELSVERLAAQLLEDGGERRDWNAAAVAGPSNEDRLPVGQHAMWYLERLAATSGLFNIVAAARIRGAVDPERLRQAFQVLVDRHAALRTNVRDRDGQPYGVVHPTGQVHFTVHDASAWSPDAVALALRSHGASSFDLAKDALLRVHVFKRTNTESVLLLVVHHQIADFWSMAILMRELGETLRGQPLPTPPSLDWRDRARWESALLASEAGQRMAKYWQDVLTPPPSPLALPLDRARPAIQSYAAGSCPFQIPISVAARLAGHARVHAATSHMAWLAVLQVLLYRYTGQTDFVLGTPTSGRTDPGWRDVVGYLVNPVVTRARIDPGMRFSELLERVRQTTAASWVHQAYPFSLLADRAGARDRSRPPVVQVLFTLQMPQSRNMEGLVGFAAGADSAAIDVAGLQWESIPVPRDTTEFDLHLVCGETADGLVGTIHFNKELFDSDTIARLATRFAACAATFADDPSASVDISLLLPSERLEMARVNDTTLEVPYEPVFRVFERSVASNPLGRAVVCRGDELNLDSVNGLANRIARRLLSHGVGRGSVVALCLDRCVELPAAMLAVMKTGAAYLPLDASLPAERLSYMVRDAGAHTAVTTARRAPELVREGLTVVCLEGCTDGDASNLDVDPSRQDAAYVLYTSGSTGHPKGVVVTHGNLVNFFAGMDRRVGCTQSDVMLAVSAATFDISILELIWVLTRGGAVVVTSAPGTVRVSPSRQAVSRTDYSLFYFAHDTGASRPGDQYRLLLEGAKFADRHDFAAVWTPERHFDPFGGLYPNPSVTAAALAMITSRVGLRAGSVVLPLHNPVRVAEEWAVVDNLTGGRVAVAFASGWHADDFALYPEHYETRKEVMYRGIETIQALWRGDAVTVTSGTGRHIDIHIHPRPIQPHLPVWITAAGSEETFQRAGRIGANVLTHLLGQTLEDVERSVRVYRRARAENGHDPDTGIVTLMVHTFVGSNHATVKDTVRTPMKQYLRGAVGLVSKLTRGLGMTFDPQSMNPRDQDALLDYAFERYFEGGAMLGSVDACRASADRFASAGIDEIACLIDFGVAEGAVLESLPRLVDVREKPVAPSQMDEHDLAAQAARYAPTLMQCTPSLLQMIVRDGASRALAPLRVLLVGGEAFPEGLLSDVREATAAGVLNMYGPTETTVWSTTHAVDDRPGPVPIGDPIVNTQLYVLDRRMQIVPPGVPGELFIGGDGVAVGYKGRPVLTASRFVADPFSEKPGTRLYRTGDWVRRRGSDGAIEWLGRVDLQMKVRGHRIELGEIEAALQQVSGVEEAAVVATFQPPVQLVAYVVMRRGGAASEVDMRDALRRVLPEHMVPQRILGIDHLPRTLNGKLDRRSLSSRPIEATARVALAARTSLEERILEAWRRVLNRDDIGIEDNFFDVGGHSLLMAQLHAVLQAEIGREWPLVHMLEYPTVAALAHYLERGAGNDAPRSAAAGGTRRAALRRRQATVTEARA